MTAKGPKIPFHVEMEFTYGEEREVWRSVRRIVAPNSGPLTQNGTNTYILGHDDLAIIDPGPADESHLAAILSAIKGQTLTHIFLTHTHKDHSSLIPALQAETGALVCAYKAITKNRGSRRAHNAPIEDGFVDLAFRPEKVLQDGEEIKGATWGVKAIHTPGHAPDHLCFAHLSEPVMFSGDHIMAWNTSVVIPPEGRMADYIASLKKLKNHPVERLMPGHGGQAREPDRLIKAYLMHRKWRENAILEHIRDGRRTIEEILPLMYPDASPEIASAACLSILAHAEHLHEQDLITASHTPLTLETALRPIEQ